MDILKEDLADAIRPIIVSRPNNIVEEIKPLSPIFDTFIRKDESVNEALSSKPPSFDETVGFLNYDVGKLRKVGDATSSSSPIGMETLTKRLISERRRTKDLEEIVRKQELEIQRLLEEKKNMRSRLPNATPPPLSPLILATTTPTTHPTNIPRGNSIQIVSSSLTPPDSLNSKSILSPLITGKLKMIRSEDTTAINDEHNYYNNNRNNKSISHSESADSTSSEESTIQRNSLQEQFENSNNNNNIVKSPPENTILSFNNTTNDPPQLTDEDIRQMLNAEVINNTPYIHSSSNNNNTMNSSGNLPFFDASNIQVLEKLVMELQTECEEKNNMIEDLNAQYKRAALILWRTVNHKLRQDVEIISWQKKFEVLQQEQSYKDELISEKDRTIENLTASLEEKNEANYKMALKLLDYQTKVSNFSLQIRKFAVKKIYRFYNSPDVEITLLKNPSNGVFSLDVNEKGRHMDRALKSVQRIRNEESKNRFLVTYTDGSRDTFESTMADEIVKSIDEILATAQSS